MVLFKLRIYTGAYSDPNQTPSMELSVDYFCGKLCLGCLTGFLNMPTLYAYFIVRKKSGRLMGKEKNALHKKIFDVSQSVFNWYGKKYEFFGRKYFLTQNF